MSGDIHVPYFLSKVIMSKFTSWVSKKWSELEDRSLKAIDKLLTPRGLSVVSITSRDSNISKLQDLNAEEAPVVEDEVVEVTE